MDLLGSQASQVSTRRILTTLRSAQNEEDDNKGDRDEQRRHQRGNQGGDGT